MYVLYMYNIHITSVIVSDLKQFLIYFTGRCSLSIEVFPIVQIIATTCPSYKNISNKFWAYIMFYFKHHCC